MVAKQTRAFFRHFHNGLEITTTNNNNFKCQLKISRQPWFKKTAKRSIRNGKVRNFKNPLGKNSVLSRLCTDFVLCSGKNMIKSRGITMFKGLFCCGLGFLVGFLFSWLGLSVLKGSLKNEARERSPIARNC